MFHFVKRCAVLRNFKLSSSKQNLAGNASKAFTTKQKITQNMTEEVLYAGNSAYRILYDDGNADVVLVLSHATGFCKEVWIPIAKELVSARSESQSLKAFVPDTTFRILALDMKGHGDNKNKEAGNNLDGKSFGEDVSAVVKDDAKRHGEATRRFGVGHSFGSTALLAAEWLNPGMFDGGLFLVEPILRRPYGRMQPSKSVLHKMTKKRKNRFQSSKDAFENFKGKGAFELWTDETLAIYSKHALKKCEDGTEELELKCPPEFESQVYICSNDVLESLATIQCEIEVLIGSLTKTMVMNKDTNQWLYWDEVSNKGEYIILPDSSHFAPMEKPKEVASLISKFVARKLLGSSSL